MKSPLAFLPGIACLMLASAPATAAEQLRIVERPTAEKTVYLTKDGVDAVGDMLSFANPIFDAANRDVIGSDQGFCVRTVVGTSWECNFTILLKGGQITVEGPFLDDGDSTFTVTGGTGRYGGAKGRMVLHTRPGKPEAYDFTFDLL